MSNDLFIPAVNIVGPGSQPQDQDTAFEYLSMPRGMSIYAQPMLPEPEDLGDVEPGLALLTDVQHALAHYPDGESRLFAIDLDPASEALVNQVLGVGEVSIGVDGPSPIEIQESVMAGLWRIRHLDGSGALMRDFLEVGACPQIVKALSFQFAAEGVNTNIEAAPQGVINAPALLVELDEKARAHRSGDAAHVINLSLLPLSPEDVQLLGERLGVGPVTILSRGYGNCRIGSSACQSVWWIKYFNSEDALILNTIEVVEIPEVALAAREDIADSAERLNEILELYR